MSGAAAITAADAPVPAVDAVAAGIGVPDVAAAGAAVVGAAGDSGLKLHGYWRSGASYRVRIALHLKGLAYEHAGVHLVRGGGEQFAPEYTTLNPQQRVPFLVHEGFGIGQSLAILDYLEVAFPAPSLVPADARARARMLVFCHAIASDIQPLHNLSTLAALGRQFDANDEQKKGWIKHWVERGLAALEAEFPDDGRPFVMGEQATWADCCLVPQLYAAERFGAEAPRYPRLAALGARLREHPAFLAAHPDRQPDAG